MVRLGTLHTPATPFWRLTFLTRPRPSYGELLAIQCSYNQGSGPQFGVYI